MTNLKIIKIPYDKKHEEKAKKEYWRSTHRAQYPKGSPISLEKLQEEGFEVGDNGQCVRETNNKMNVELILDRLSSRQRQVVELRMDDYSFREIAEKLGIKEQSARWLKRQAKKIIGKILNKS